MGKTRKRSVSESDVDFEHFKRSSTTRKPVTTKPSNWGKARTLIKKGSEMSLQIQDKIKGI